MVILLAFTLAGLGARGAPGGEPELLPTKPAKTETANGPGIAGLLLAQAAEKAAESGETPEPKTGVESPGEDALAEQEDAQKAEPESADKTPPNSRSKEEAASGQDYVLAVGLALGLPPIPTETDFTGAGTTFDLFVSYDFAPGIGLRAGFNQASATMDEVTLTTGSPYLAYRYHFDVTERFSGVLLAGLAQIQGNLEASNTTTGLSASTMGAIVGFQVTAVFPNDMELGGQYLLLYGEADFDGVSINVGSNQVLFSAAYNFGFN